jgi:hypothetical protein
VEKLSEKFSISLNLISTIFKKIKILETKSNDISQQVSSLNLFYKFKQLQKVLKYLVHLNSFN